MYKDMRVQIPISDIYVDYKQNSRGVINEDDAMDLLQSIQRAGLINPVTLSRSDPKITDKKYTLTAGYTRFYVCTKYLEWREIPATLTKVDPFLVMTEENLVRANLTMYQEAVWLKRWSDEQGLNMREICKKLGKSKTWVSARLKLLDLDEETQRLAETNQMPAIEIIRRHQKKVGAKNYPETRASNIKAKITKRTRLNAEMQDLVRQMVDHDGAGGEPVAVLNWASGQIDDTQLIKILGYAVTL